MSDAWFFAGKTALVTGSASGMGRAVTTQLLRAGCRVVGLDIADQDDGPSHQFEPVLIDLADADELSRLLDGWLWSLDFVVNAAGVSPLRETTQRVLAVDWEAPRRICDWAVILRTMQLAGAHAARRVRVNAVSPHAAATPMHYAIKRDEPEMYARANMTATWGRWSSADEQADVIVFLLGPRSSYVSGVNIVVDGGWWAAAQTMDPSLRQFP
jgi:NAD(P)-dependent dehydrogenase (short-subunit alcohol dehydrogenase family)